MKKISLLFTQIVNHWKRQSLAQKITLGYLLLILVILTFLPMFVIYSLNDDSSVILNLANASMTKTFSLIFLCGLYLLVWNASPRLRNRSYIIFGFQASQPLVTFMGLTIILCMLLTMSDVISIVREYMSTNIQMHTGFIILVMILLLGMIWQLMVARLVWKSKSSQQEISLHKQEYHSKDSFYNTSHGEKTLF